MLLKRTDIEERLARVRVKEISEQELISQVHTLLKVDKTESYQEARIQQTILKGPSMIANRFTFDLLETKRIYHLNQIKKICIDYRLRFLHTRYFKGGFPEEALSEIKNLEGAHEIELQGFRIIAPSKLFKLKDKDDPLLFAPIGNDYYYLIHKWGNNLHPLRKLLVWPFKNIINLTILVALLSYLLTLIVPKGLFSKASSSAEFWIVFFFMFKCVASMVIFYGFALGKNFNPAIWRSKYFN